MTEVVIRELTDDEVFEQFSPLTGYAFSPTPPLLELDEVRQRYPDMAKRTVYGVFEDGQLMTGAASIDMTQNIRGDIYEMGGVGPVASYPLGRRKGYVRQVMTKLLYAMHQQGKAVSTLYPFRESFYERMGYALLTQPQRVTFAPGALAPLLRTETLTGSLEHMLLKDGYDAIYRPFMRVVQQHLHGMGRMPGYVAERQRDNAKEWLVVARDETNEPIGIMTYKIDGYLGKLVASAFYYRNALGRYWLLNWCARHIDQVKTIDIKLPRHEQPAAWFADISVTPDPDIWLTPMGRVLDMQRLQGMHVGEGSFSARIIDPLCDWNTGNYTFSSREGVLEIDTAIHPQCEITMQALSALVYGTHDPADFVFRGWGNPDDHTQQAMQALFPPMMTHLHEQF